MPLARTVCALLTTVVPAHSYQYSFAPNSEWTGFYAPAQEIHKYLERVAKRYSADRFIKTRHEVKGCYYDEKLAKWYGSTSHNIMHHG